MADKDFLEQFSKTKPDSFKEEERIPVTKEKKPVNKVLIGVIALVAIIALVVCYFVFLAPKIEMPEFVGQTKTDVVAWVKQQDIETGGVIFKEEYNFDYDANVVISQSEESGKKIKNNAKLTFVVSLGADPEEKVSVPNLESMDKEQIEKWIKDNKLQKTKITTVYSDTVEEGYVISYTFTGVDEDSFTRGSTLKIQISKGPQPVSTVTVENFVNKSYADASAWASSKKIKALKVDGYSNTVEVGNVISQSIAAGEKINEGESITFTVSLGKGVTMPDLGKLSRDDVDKFLKENGISAKTIYSTSSAYVLSQSPKAGKVVGADEKIEVTINKGSSYYLEDIGVASIVGMDCNKFVDILNSIRSSGIDAYAGSWSNPDGVYSDKYFAGQIVSVVISDTNGKTYNANDRLPLDTRFDVILSKGKIYTLKELVVAEGGKYKTSALVDALAAQSIPFTITTDKDECNLFVNDVEVTGAEVTIYQNSKIELKEIEIPE